jgi:pyruvate dehydrogenase E1 component
MPEGEGIAEGILQGLYRFRPADHPQARLRAQLFGSGAIMNEVLEAQRLLAERYDVAADVWSVTSYKELRRNGLAVERWNMLHAAEPARLPYLTRCLADAPGVFVAASDYMKALPDSVARWFPKLPVSLGTDGFGRSDGRRALRNFFEVDARFITLATLSALAREGQLATQVVQQAMRELAIPPEKIDPMMA